MPRKTRPLRRLNLSRTRFNEAAARCHGKLEVQRHRAARLDAASMRPRPDATENADRAALRPSPLRGFNEAAARCHGKLIFGEPRVAAGIASMRPRPDATENARAAVVEELGPRASMRPRPDATENAPLRVRDRGSLAASMRPRPDATENAETRRRGPSTSPRFNEAAARCHGKHDEAAVVHVVRGRLQ